MRRHSLPFRLGAGVAASSLVLFGAAACSDDEPVAEDTNQSEESESESEETEAEETESEETEFEESTETEETEETEAAEGSADGATPAWAFPATTEGEQIAELSVGDVQVQVFQVGTGTAPEDSMLVDNETKEPLLKKGDPVVFLNYVITNNGDPIDLGSSLVSVDAEHADWPYLGGMPTVSDDASYEAQGINPQLRDPSTDLPDPAIYTFGSGEVMSYGAAFKYEAGKEITIEADYVPVDAEGELLHDDGQEAEGSATLK